MLEELLALKIYNYDKVILSYLICYIHVFYKVIIYIDKIKD